MARRDEAARPGTGLLPALTESARVCRSGICKSGEKRCFRLGGEAEDVEQPRPLEVGVDHPAKGRAVVAVSGDLDLSGVGVLREALRSASASPLVVLDLSRCTFCDSSGLHTILEAAHRAHLADSSFRVAGIGVQVGRVFELTGTAGYLDLFPDLRTALKGERAS